MKLYKEADNQWAARMHLEANLDIDIEVSVFPCNRSIVSVNIIRSDYPEGMVLCHGLNGIRVYMAENNVSLGSMTVKLAQAKTFVWGKPDVISLMPINKTIKLEYQDEQTPTKACTEV